MAAPRSSSEVVNTFGFNVPCRRFHIAYNVTHDRRLPVVDEFVLRLLATAESLPAARVGSFFGLSGRELEIVLRDLVASDLLTIQGESVRLSRRSKEAFRNAEGNPPRVVEVATWLDSIWIELVSRNLMIPSRTRSAENLIPLNAAAAARTVPEDFAKSTFEDHFRRIISQIREVNNPERFRLYSISNVVPDRFGSVVVKAELQLVLDPHPHTILKVGLGEQDEQGRFRELLTGMHDAVRGLSFATPSEAAVSDLRRLTGDTSISDFLRRDESFRLSEWLAWTNRHSVRGRTAIFGHAYVARNVERFVQELRAALPRLQRSRPGVDLVWMRPSGSDWGSTPDVATALEAFVGAVRPGLADGASVRTTIVAAPSLRAETRRFRRLFQRGILSSAPNLASGVEVLLVPGVAAMVTIPIALNANDRLAVGLLVTSPEDLARFERVLHLHEVDLDGEEVWNRNAKTRSEAETASGGEGVA